VTLTGIKTHFLGCLACSLVAVLTVLFVSGRRSLKISKLYEGHLESKERFAIKKYLSIIGKKKNMQVLSHTFTYFST